MTDKNPDITEQMAAGTFDESQIEDMIDPEEQAERERRADEFASFTAPIGGALDRAFDLMERRADGRDKPVPLPWPKVETVLGGGLWRGLHILVGNTGSGKSQWALQAALHAAKAGVPALYIGLELDDESLATRVAGLHTRRKWSRLMLGEDGDEVGRVREECAELAELPLYLETAGPNGWSYDRLAPRARALLERHPGPVECTPDNPSRPALVVLDFLQIMSGDGDDLRQMIKRAVYAGRAVAQQHNVAVLMVSSTSRENYGLLDNVPPTRTATGQAPKWWKPLGTGHPGRLIGLGKESGEVEYAADSVLVLGNERDRALIGGQWSTKWLAVAKLRAQPDSKEAKALGGWVEMRFNGGWFDEAMKVATEI